MMSRFDERQRNVSFVKLVQRFECLWDTQHAAFGNKYAADVAWSEIAKECKESAIACREKWRNIKTALAFSERKRPSKPYYLKPYLQFILSSKKGLTNGDAPPSKPNSTAVEEDDFIDISSMDNSLLREFKYEDEIDMSPAEHPLPVQLGRPGNTESEYETGTFSQSTQTTPVPLSATDENLPKNTLPFSIHSPQIRSDLISPSAEKRMEMPTYPRPAQTYPVLSAELAKTSASFCSNDNHRPQLKRLRTSENNDEDIMSGSFTEREQNLSADLHFFKSLLPDLQKLNDHERRVFRQTVLKCLDEMIMKSGSNI